MAILEEFATLLPRNARRKCAACLMIMSLHLHTVGSIGSYLELRGARCLEIQGSYPIGAVGTPWSDSLWNAASSLCDSEAHCIGVMHYVGSDQASCEEWCGRPQFCTARSQDSDGELSLNRDWESFVKVEYAPNLGLPAIATAAASRKSSLNTLHLGPSGDSAKPFQAYELFRQAACEELGFQTKQEAPPVVLFSAVPPMGRPLFQGACQVLYQKFGSPPLDSSRDLEMHGLNGILSEAEQPDMPLFTAAPAKSKVDMSVDGDLLSVLPKRYFFDHVLEYPTDRLGIPGQKKHILSIYYLDAASRCPGPDNVSFWPDDAVSQLSGPHVYVEDGTHATREAAFKEYHFTLLCGDFTREPFPPIAFVYSLAYASSALVPEWMHWRASRMFFHLPDAAQGYKTLNVANLEPYLTDLITNPKKDEVMEFKQTFMLLSQQLFWYRYRQSARHRAESAACALCDAQERYRRRNVAGSTSTLEGNSSESNSFPGVVTPAVVAALFCGMSRRSAHALRKVIRETWGNSINGQRSAATMHRFFVGQPSNSENGDSTPTLADAAEGDVVELPVPEGYRTLNIKVFALMEWVHSSFPNLQWIIKHDDDVYLRPGALLAQLSMRAPIKYLWGNFDHGSSPVRDTAHQHYNSYEQFPQQHHPMWGDIFPPYARGSLWVMSADLLDAVVAEWVLTRKTFSSTIMDESMAESLPHPDDPAVGIMLSELVQKGMSLNLDDRDFNSFSLNPSCSSKFSNIHNRTWVIHHVKPETMRCMWNLDTSHEASNIGSTNSAIDASMRIFPDLCLCSTEVQEEDDTAQEGSPFWYPRQRFNTAR